MSVVALVVLLFRVYSFLIMVRILGSWVPEWQQYRFMQFIAFYTDPYLNFFRRFIPPIGGMLDLSPIVAFIALDFIKMGFVSLLGGM